jgi:UDP-glucose 4-epimerase
LNIVEIILIPMVKNKIANSVILITGGAGFIGSYVVEYLLQYQPKKIYIIDNLLRGNYENMLNFIKNHKVDFIKNDITNNKLIDKLMSKSDYCFHLAALRINACAADPVAAFDVMAKATFNIVQAAHRYKIKKFIYSSSASVFGLAQHFPTPETDNPYDNKTIYGACKSFGEQLLRSYHHMYGLNYIGLRYFNVYGPRMDVYGKYTEVLIRWLDCIKKRTNPIIYGDGLTSADFIYVTDVAKANILALLSDTTDEVFNIGTGKETSLKKLLLTLLRVNHSDLSPIFKSETTVNPVKRRWADITKAKKMIRFEPEVPVEKGLKLLSEWYFNLIKSSK